MPKEDLVRLSGPAVVGVRTWNKEWASLAMDLVQGRRAWSAAVRDAVNAMDADSARAGWMSSQVEVEASGPWPAMEVVSENVWRWPKTAVRGQQS